MPARPVLHAGGVFQGERLRVKDSLDLIGKQYHRDGARIMIGLPFRPFYLSGRINVSPLIPKRGEPSAKSPFNGPGPSVLISADLKGIVLRYQRVEMTF